MVVRVSAAAEQYDHEQPSLVNYAIGINNWGEPERPPHKGTEWYIHYYGIIMVSSSCFIYMLF